MSDDVLRRIEAIIQRDVNHRGLATDPEDNLLTACKGDFAAACEILAKHVRGVSIVTGFYIPLSQAGETDGPLGAMFLARVLVTLKKSVRIYSDDFCLPALQFAANHRQPPHETVERLLQVKGFFKHANALTLPLTECVIAIERSGPSHSQASMQAQGRSGAIPLDQFLAQVPPKDWDHYHTMRGTIITQNMFAAHPAFEKPDRTYWTIGIGDGGNEIGMGKIPWETIAKNVPNGGLVACRVPTDYNIVCGVSNWGAYGMAAGVWHLRGRKFDEDLFSADRERELWEQVLKEAVLVDGVTGQRTLTVDGLSWEEYIQPLREIAAILRGAQ